MIEILVTPTGKGYNPRDSWTHLAMRAERCTVEDMDAARKWLRERYGKCKRVPMYRDRDNAPPLKVGYIFGYRNADYSHSPVQHWLQQDWVELREVITKPVNLK